MSAYAVEETLPAGLAPYDISEGGSWDVVNRKIKWGPYFDNTARTLSYKLGGIAGVYTLSGVGSYDGQSVLTTGSVTIDLESSLRVAPSNLASPGQGFTLSFPTQAGRQYYIEFSDNLTGCPWQVADGPLSGTGQSIHWTDDGTKTGGWPAGSGARFYRVRSSP